MAALFFLVYLAFSFIVLSQSFKLIIWEVGSILYLLTASFVIGMPWFIGVGLWLLVISIDLLLRLDSIRDWIANYLYSTVKDTLPKLSKTEEEALNAGDTWFEKDIFIGQPNFDALNDIDTHLSEEERSFIENETQTLCSMLDEWDINQNQDLPKDVWEYIKAHGFLGMVIAKEYGGKGFSATAHSDVVMKIASRSGVAAVTVMVPNSLGPGELLQFYGTDEQKKHYLPRLASGEEIPCFALTEPGAGSDATSIKSEAIVVEKKINGKTTLGLNLTLNKRWITLAPVATLVGLAVDLKDPDSLLKGTGQEGITCILIPRETKNLEIGNRHLPADQPFMNGTIRGENIFVPISHIIGGQEKAGSGWQMLVECLSIGRSISLPALAAASSSISYLTSGAFAKIRRQFNVDIAQFEGVQEKMAEIAGLNYLINATRKFTLAAVNEKKKPSVASAITKYFNTELARIAVNGAMDLHAGRAVVVGPRNYMTNFYQSIPIAVTVEGANIMTRNLLIFGQGSMACHPYLREEFYALSKNDKPKFKKVIWQHIEYFCKNFASMMCSSWTGGLFLSAPHHALHRECQRLKRLSQAFSWLSDLALITLGGKLKRKERLSARLADGMSYLYLSMAVVRAYQQNPNPEQLLHARWALAYCFYHAQKSMISFCQNFPKRPIGIIARLLAFPMGQSMRYPSDKLEQKLAKMMTENNHYRNQLKESVYLSGDKTQPVDRMEQTLQAILRHQDLYDKVRDLKQYKFGHLKAKLEERVAAGSLSQEELEVLVEIEKMRWDAIQVDEFAFDSMKNKTFEPVNDKYQSPLE